MKTFVKENWYKLITGCSMFIFSIGFFIYSITPAHSKPESIDNSYKTSIQLPINEIKSSTGGLDKIENYVFIGCGTGIYYYDLGAPHFKGDPIKKANWVKLL